MEKPLRGIVTPLVTPLLDNDTIDSEGLERLIEHVINGGVSGIFVLGTTGEFASLSLQLRKELIKKVCQTIKTRVPVLAGVSDSAFTESLNLAKQAADCGADAVVLTPPYYFTPGQAELLEYLRRIMAHIPLPLFIYNMPVHTKVVFEPETVREAASIPGITGMKDSSGNLEYFRQIRQALAGHPDFTFLIGPEELLAEFVMTGGHGGVSGGSNMFPKIYVRLYEAALKKDTRAVRDLQETILKISAWIYRVGHFSSSYIKGIKCSLSLMGICSDFMAEPFHRFREPERIKIKEILDKLNFHELL